MKKDNGHRKTLSVHKRRMAYMGYYTQSDYAREKKVSRQYISKLLLKKDNSLNVVEGYGRVWIKLDDGQNAQRLYGENPMDMFLNFGFKRRIKSIVESSSVVCDIKLLDGISKVAIQFYNEKGDMLALFADLNESEIIDYN